MNHETDNQELKEVIRIIEDNGSGRPTGHNEVARLIARIRELEKFKIATWEHSCFRPRILNVDQVCDVCHASIPQGYSNENEDTEVPEYDEYNPKLKGAAAEEARSDSKKPEGACCNNEQRGWNGGCGNCGDPCL
jgi:hypothetical protein